MRTVIIGGVAGGASAAARLRRLDEKMEIIIIEKSGFISYANCGLPYYIGGIITDRSQLTLQTPESFWKRFRIEARVSEEVLSIDRERKEISIRKLKDGSEYKEHYDTLILSPGAKAIVPALPGIDSEKVLTLRHTEDSFRIREEAIRHKGGRAIVIGGGFIGLETAENLVHAGLNVTLIQRSEHVLPPFDRDGAVFLHSELRKNGVNLHLNTAVTGFEETGNGIAVIAGSQRFEADFAVLAIGVKPDSHLASEAGLETDKRGSIIVSDRMLTSDPSIYAVGDAVSIRNRITGLDTMIALAGPANKEGRIAADNIAGLDSRYRGSTGASVVKLFSLTAASVGINEDSAKNLGMNYDTAVTFQGSHASYYPGAETMMLKLVYDKGTGRVLGAEAVGKEGVEKRIDTISVAIAGGMTVEDLVSLDMSYAPPYSSAKDPVNILGYIAENKRHGILREFTYSDIKAFTPEHDLLIDLRTEREIASGMIEDAINIPLDDLRSRIAEIDRTKKIHVYCRSGQRSYIGMRILKGYGIDSDSLSGGYLLYEAIMDERSGS